ncbi:OPT superfamily [Neonectria magnoliae]|uniref:OPT superfamily n=1 Tax=Neonectria magnoliae TaxID=2732573 RepID=A0ABR1HMT9_9HYPO
MADLAGPDEMDQDHLENTSVPASKSISSLTLRSTTVGIAVGLLICLSNIYFGLLSGFIAIMSLPSTILGFAFFRMFQDQLRTPFTPAEHATLVVIASSLGLMPFTIGAVGVLPAMEFLTDAPENGPFRLSWVRLTVWSVGVSILGVVVTLPLRKRFIVQEPLAFPFGTSSATMMASLHRDASIAERISWAQNDASNPYGGHHDAPVPPITTFFIVVGCLIGWGVLSPIAETNGWVSGPTEDWETGARGWIMWIAVALILGDAAITIFMMLLRSFEVYIYPPLVNLIDYLDSPFLPNLQQSQRGHRDEAEPLLSDPDPARASPKVTSLSYRDDGWSTRSYLVWLALGLVLCFSSMFIIFWLSVPIMALVLAVLVILPLSLVSIRCYGETGTGGTASISTSSLATARLLSIINNALGKIPLFLFALLIPQSNPNAILLSLAVAGVVEASVWQAAEMMDEFKMGHLVDAPPRSLFYGQLIGSVVGSLVSMLVYRLYTTVFHFPSDAFPMPSAHIWISTARLVYGRGLPPALLPFGIVASLMGASFKALKSAKFIQSWSCWVPSSIALAAGRPTPQLQLLPSPVSLTRTGMYILPDMVMAQAIGGLAHYLVLRRWGRARESRLISVATGFILGEGLFSLVTMLMQSLKIPHL